MNQNSLCLSFRAPLVVWFSRFALGLAALFAARFLWLHPGSGVWGVVLGGGVLAVSALGMIASFVRHFVARLVMVLPLVGIPLMIAIGMNASVLDTRWWGWFTIFPAQILPFVAWASLLWTGSSKDFFVETAPSELHSARET